MVASLVALVFRLFKLVVVVVEVVVLVVVVIDGSSSFQQCKFSLVVVSSSTPSRDLLWVELLTWAFMRVLLGRIMVSSKGVDWTLEEFRFGGMIEK